jgi:hypothetical protein
MKENKSKKTVRRVLAYLKFKGGWNGQNRCKVKPVSDELEKELKWSEDGALELKWLEDWALKRKWLEDGAIELKWLEDGTLELKWLEDWALKLKGLDDGALELKLLQYWALKLQWLEDGALELKLLEDWALKLKWLEDWALELKFVTIIFHPTFDLWSHKIVVYPKHPKWTVIFLEVTFCLKENQYSTHKHSNFQSNTNVYLLKLRSLLIRDPIHVTKP